MPCPGISPWIVRRGKGKKEVPDTVYLLHPVLSQIELAGMGKQFRAKHLGIVRVAAVQQAVGQKFAAVHFVLIHQGIIIIGQYPAHQVVHIFAPFGTFRHSTQNGGIQLLYFLVSLFFKQGGIMAGIIP